MIKLKDMVNIHILMALLTKGTGKKINSMDMECKVGLITLSLKETIIMGKNMEKVSFIGGMVVNMKGSF